MLNVLRKIRRLFHKLRTPELDGRVELVSSRKIDLAVRGATESTTLRIQALVNDVALPSHEISSQRLGDADHLLHTSLKLPKRFALKPGDIINVRLKGNRTEFAGSPWIYREAPIPVPTALLHIPKTAGTSLRVSLERALGSNLVFPNSAYLRKNGGKYLGPDEIKVALSGAPSGLRLIQGHFSLSQLREIASAANIVTVLREPVARAVSLLGHFKNIHGLSLTTDEILSASGPLAKAATNHQTYLLSCLPKGAPPDEQLDSAKRTLESISVIGLTERYEDTLKLCEQYFEVSIESRLHMNVGRKESAFMAPEILEQLKSWNDLDGQLYRHADAILTSRLLGT